MKKKHIILSITLLLLLFLSSCFERKCDCYADYPPNAILETYFSNYRYGSQSWVYVNRDETKRDTVFLTWNPQESGRGIIMDETNCITEYLWSTILNSKYLSTDIVRCSYSTFDFSLYTFLDVKFSFNFRSDSDSDTMYISSRKGSYSFEKKMITLPSGQTFNNVISVEERLWFAPYIGLIKYASNVPFNQVDTFYLQKFNQK